MPIDNLIKDEICIPFYSELNPKIPEVPKETSEPVPFSIVPEYLNSTSRPQLHPIIPEYYNSTSQPIITLPN